MDKKDIEIDLQNLMNSLAMAGVRVMPKSSRWYFRALHRVFMWFNKVDKFYSNYTTTIGKTIYVPTLWGLFPDESKISIISHELEHVKQYQRYTVPLMGLMYMLLPLPVGLAYFRYRFERVAYARGIKTMLIYWPEGRQALIDDAVEQLTGPDYLYTWPFKKSVKAWFEGNV